MQHYRRAALELHSLDQVDQRWLLSNVPAEHRMKLNEMLSELVQLGIPKESTMFEELAIEENLQTLAPKPEQFLPEHEELAHADPLMVASLCADEPDFLVATLFQMNDWPWMEQVFALLHETRQRSIKTIIAANSSPLNEATARALSAAISKRLQNVQPLVESRQSDDRYLQDHDSAKWAKFGWLPWRK